MATVIYKCPNCGGGLMFDPGAQQYKCDYCLSEFTQAELDSMTPEGASDQNAGADTRQPAGGEARTSGNPDGDAAQAAMVYTCPSCGAEIVTDETTAASFCYYCHNPVVLGGRLEGTYHPDFVVPFAIDKEKAAQIFADWIKKKRFVPTAFYSKDQVEKLTGVYFPYWLYNCRVDGALAADAVRLKVWSAGNIRYTETQTYDVVREGSMEVKHVTRNALKKANRELAEGVLPYEMKGIKPFSMAYLSGFMAEKRDMEKQQFEQEVETEVRTFAENSLKSAIGPYDRVQVRESQAQIENPDWKYALFPVWTLTYRDKGKDQVYYFALNGQTGKICGVLPVDKVKLGILFAEVFFPLLAVLLIVGYLI